MFSENSKSLLDSEELGCVLIVAFLIIVEKANTETSFEPLNLTKPTKHNEKNNKTQKTQKTHTQK